MFFEDIAVTHRHMHFVGIGGIGMSGLAEILLDLGYKVSGSDLRSTDITKASGITRRDGFFKATRRRTSAPLTRSL